MAAFSGITLVKSEPAAAGGDCVHYAMGTAVGPTDAGAATGYETGGSVFDLSGVFKDKVYAVIAYVDNASYRLLFVPATLYDSATCLMFVDDNAGGQVANTTGLQTDLAVVHWHAWGTDG